MTLMSFPHPLELYKSHTICLNYLLLCFYNLSFYCHPGCHLLIKNDLTCVQVVDSRHALMNVNTWIRRTVSISEIHTRTIVYLSVTWDVHITHKTCSYLVNVGRLLKSFHRWIFCSVYVMSSWSAGWINRLQLIVYTIWCIWDTPSRL